MSDFANILREHFGVDINEVRKVIREDNNEEKSLPFIIRNSIYVEVNDDGNIDIGIAGKRIVEFLYEEDEDGNIKITDIKADKSNFDDLSEFLTKEVKKQEKKED